MSATPAEFQATLTDNTCASNARAGILIDAVAATVDGNDCGDTNQHHDETTGSSIYAQNGAIVTGSDTVIWPDPPLDY